MSVVRRRWLAVLVATVLVLAGAAGTTLLVRDGEEAAPPPPRPSPTGLEDVDLSALQVPRGTFCDAIEPDDVERALAGRVADTAHYDSGQRAALAPGVRDVSHEYACTYRGPGGTEARAWVFAEPVRRASAARLVREARGARGCQELSDVPAFGTPSVGTSCRSTRPARTEITLRGLFGDAWLSCQVSAPTPEGLTARAEQWCVQVATSVSAG